MQWNNTLHLDDLLNVPALSASAMTFGYEYIGDTAKVRVNENSISSSVCQFGASSMTTDAVYAGLQTTLLQRLALTGQVRQDWVEDNAPTTWRIGGVYDLKEIATHLKLSYGTGFRAPSLFERFGVDSFGYVGNPASETRTIAGLGGWLHDRYCGRGEGGFRERRRHLFRPARAQPDRWRLFPDRHRH